ncbi:unnamed protein product [Chondrus crispus]|uniref:Uncharacterized protein n=1 Tax=Chondrus crispus TaxID=2769 RepID=R7QDN1_CHOCR|nr:unnamed protein product [Chondrus crispus]CDF36199.1 unnamed protein product [Chondrus crispus]|eukprot:XP_005716018.1 unnamed protein product [Chondrus crispus]
MTYRFSAADASKWRFETKVSGAITVGGRRSLLMGFQTTATLTFAMNHSYTERSG